MNSYEIENTVAKDKRLNRNFLGVFASDELPLINKRPSCLIANTDPSDKPGEHWIAIYFDKQVEYFDSYGLQPLDSFKVYKPDVVNEYCLQNWNTAVCGEFCIYFLCNRSRGVCFNTIINKLREKSNADKFVKQFVNKIGATSEHTACQCCVPRVPP